MEELIIEKEKTKIRLAAAVHAADEAMKLWQEKTKAVTEIQNKLMNLNAVITTSIL